MGCKVRGETRGQEKTQLAEKVPERERKKGKQQKTVLK